MKRKKASHFSVEDIIRREFRKPVSRGTIGRDAGGLMWAYGVILRDSLYCVEVIGIDMESHETKRLSEREKSFERREEANAYITGLKREIRPTVPETATADAA
ncbi:MAG: hypothetical protein HZB33_14835 [Nitrospirae bacterium]|nr:hypothetical protein [Nitrospirota bacterium]